MVIGAALPFAAQSVIEELLPLHARIDVYVRPLATAGAGSPLPCTMLDLFIASRLGTGAPDPEGWAGELGAARSREEQDRLRAFIERVLASRAPVWRRSVGPPFKHDALGLQ